LFQDFIRSRILCPLQKSISFCFQILVLLMRGQESSQLFTHSLRDIRILGDQVSLHNAIKQLALQIFTQCAFILRVALLSELIEHILESCTRICFRFNEDTQIAETILFDNMLLNLCLVLEE